MPALRRPGARRVGLAAAVAAAPVALAYRFALIYRVRAGYPRQHPPQFTPSHVGLAYQSLEIPAGDTTLPGWFIPAGPDPGPGVAIVHGWESARDRMLPHAQVLHAAGLHVLVADIRGHGANPPETLPISGGEFGADAGRTFDALLSRPEVTRGGLVGHSMGGVGALLAAAADPRVHAVVSVSAPADPYRLTRQTFRLAQLPLPDLVAYPLAWLTTRVYVRPRGHTVEDIDASRAVARVAAPLLLVHGTDDTVVPIEHQQRLAQAAERSRLVASRSAPVELLTIHGGRHSWLYEFPEYRRTVAAFLVRHLGGPLDPRDAAARAEAVPATRLIDATSPAAALANEPGGFRSLGAVLRRRPAGPTHEPK